ERQEDVVAAIGPVMVGEMVVAAPAAARKPSAEMNTPVEFFNHDLVSHKSQKHSRSDVHVEQEIDWYDQRPVDHKKDDNPERRTAQVDVISFERRSHRAVMAQMSQRQKVLRQMQKIAVIEVFERIRPDQPHAKSNEPFLGGRGKEVPKQQGWRQPGKHGGKGILALS